MKRSKFSLSHHKLFSCDMGELIPIALTEVLPGDTIQQATSMLVRVSPLLAPVMHPVHMRIHHWFVPHRLVWDDWEDFITGGPDGEDDSVFPQMNLGPAQTYQSPVGSLFDYLGIPEIGAGAQPFAISALPLRGYALIWNEWYRDQDLQTPLGIDTTSGVDTTTSAVLQSCAWEKDYFTSARPWAQKGPAVSISLGATAPVQPDGTSPFMERASGGPDRNILITGGGSNAAIFSGGADAGVSEAMNFVLNKTGLMADLSSATPISINALREAFALQRFAEARARYGSRYTEYLRYLGIRSSDARLQRPEYLGGGKQTIQFSEVLQTGVTSDGDDTEGVGNLKGHGIGAVRSNRYRRFFEEHGYIFSLMSVRPKTIYTQGVARHWNRDTREEFYQKELQHIGQQQILRREIYANDANYLTLFGYQDRYDEYRRMESNVSGDFRTTELDFWHMGRIFTSAPALNADFVNCLPTKRINAVQDEDVLWCMAHHSIQARRLLSKTGSSFIF